MGSYASKLGVSPALYYGLQPVALELLIELAARVRSLSGGASPLIVSSAVADRQYQRRSASPIRPPPTDGRSRSPAGTSRGTQAGAFQAMLDRLQALNLIAWQRYPTRSRSRSPPAPAG